MKLVFSGLETPIDLAPGYASTLQVANETLFARNCSLFGKLSWQFGIGTVHAVGRRG